MPEMIIGLLIAVLVRAVFFPWGSRAVCHDVFSGLFGGGSKGGGGGSNQSYSAPTYTVSTGLPSAFTGGGPGSGGGVSGGRGAGAGASAAPSGVQPFSGNLTDAFAQGATQTAQPDGSMLLVFPSGETFTMPGATTGSPASPGAANPLGTPSATNSNFLGIPANRV